MSSKGSIAAVYIIHDFCGVSARKYLEPGYRGLKPKGHFSAAVLMLGRCGGAWLLEPGSRRVCLPLVHMDSTGSHFQAKGFSEWLQQEVKASIRQHVHPDVEVEIIYSQHGMNAQTDASSCGPFAAVNAAHMVAKVATVVDVGSAQDAAAVHMAVKGAICDITQEHVLEARRRFG